MYALFLFIFFPILYNKNRTWYFIYALLFFLIGRFIAYKAGISYATIIHNVFFIGILIPFITDRAYHKFFLPVLLWVLVYASYLFFLHLSHGNDFFRDLKDNFRILVVFIFAVQGFESVKTNKIDMGYFVKAFSVILIFEVLLGWMQYCFHDFGNFFRITEYTWNGEVRSMSGDKANILDASLCFGTLMRPSGYANYLATSIVVLFLAKSKSGFKTSDYLFLGFSILTLLITGIRAPFLILLFMLFFIVMRGKKTHQKILYLATGLAAFIFLLPFLSTIGSKGGLESYDNTVLRSLNVFTQIEEGTVTEESTLIWPLSMMPYIADNPLFGNGLHHGSGYFLALNFHILEDYSISDAGIFFYWAEYGLVGLLIFFFFYYYIVKISPQYGFDKSDIRFLVIMLFLQSIVDIGVLDNNCTTVFAIAPIMIMYYSRVKDSRKEFVFKHSIQKVESV